MENLKFEVVLKIAPETQSALDNIVKYLELLWTAEAPNVQATIDAAQTAQDATATAAAPSQTPAEKAAPAEKAKKSAKAKTKAEAEASAPAPPSEKAERLKSNAAYPTAPAPAPAPVIGTANPTTMPDVAPAAVTDEPYPIDDFLAHLREVAKSLQKKYNVKARDISDALCAVAVSPFNVARPSELYGDKQRREFKYYIETHPFDPQLGRFLAKKEDEAPF